MEGEVECWKWSWRWLAETATTGTLLVEQVHVKARETTTGLAGLLLIGQGGQNFAATLAPAARMPSSSSLRSLPPLPRLPYRPHPGPPATLTFAGVSNVCQMTPARRVPSPGVATDRPAGQLETGRRPGPE